MKLPVDAREELQSTAIAFVELVGSHDPATSVPTCPGWTIRDLANHQADTWNFWSRVVADGITERTQLKSITAPTDLDGDLLIDWLATSHHALISAVSTAEADQPVWTWTGSPQDVSWVVRRMLHESSIHLWDLANAIGPAPDVPTAIAADGIDEFLTWFMGRSRREGEMKVGGTVHIHCTDTTDEHTAGGEWFVSSVKEPTCTFTREHRKGDAALRGRASDLVLWLWRRLPLDADGVEVIGDEVVARRFRAYTDLAW